MGEQNLVYRSSQNALVTLHRGVSTNHLQCTQHRAHSLRFATDTQKPGSAQPLSLLFAESVLTAPSFALSLIASASRASSNASASKPSPG